MINIIAFWHSELVYHFKNRQKTDQKDTNTSKTQQANRKKILYSPFSFYFSHRCHSQPEICQSKSILQSWHNPTSTLEAARCRFHGQLHLQFLIVLRVGYASIMPLKSLQGEFNNFGWALQPLQYKISKDDEPHHFSHSWAVTYRPVASQLPKFFQFTRKSNFSCWLLTDSCRE